MATNPTLMRQALSSKLTQNGVPVSLWRSYMVRLRQEPLAVVLLVWGALFLLAWLYFTWLD